MRIPWLQALGQLTRAGTVRRFVARRDDPERAQREVLAEILAGLRGTTFGAERGLDAVSDLEGWRARVPIQAPTEHQAEVARVMAGERTRLFRDPVLAWAGTSGTGGSRKLYPITAGYRRQYLRTVAVFLWAMTRDHPRAFDHGLLYLTGPYDEGRAADGGLLTSMSGFNAGVQPAFLQRRYAVPVAAADLPDGVDRASVVARCAAARRVSLAVSIMPAGLVALARTLASRAEDVVRDVHDGTIRGLPGPSSAPFQAWLLPDPKRAAALERALRDGVDLTRLWPDLRLISCWKAAAAGAFVPELARLAPGIPIRDAIYSATEGWLNVPMSDPALGGPAASIAHLIELLPAAGGPPRWLHEAEVGGRYRVVVSTAGGCYRYDLGDLVDVTGRWGRTPTLVFVRKDGAASNLAGELLDAAQVIDAARAAGSTCGEALFYAVIPDADGAPPRYRVYVEHPDPDAFAAALDRALRAECVDYGPKRDAGALGPLTARPLPPASWDRLRAARAREGAIEAQIKPPVLTADPGWIAALREVATGADRPT